MSYTQTTWVNGAKPSIDADNLNKMEQGIADAHSGVDTLTKGLSAETTARESAISSVNENLAQRNVKTFTDISQLGLESADTIEQIISALPNRSELVFPVASGSALANSLPVKGNTCELRITKTTSSNGGRGRIECKDYRSKAVHINYYYNGTLGAWDTNALNSDLAKIGTVDHIAAMSLNVSGNYDITKFRKILIGFAIGETTVDFKEIPVDFIPKTGEQYFVHSYFANTTYHIDMVVAISQTAYRLKTFTVVGYENVNAHIWGMY